MAKKQKEAVVEEIKDTTQLENLFLKKFKS
jgi:hypothetical protein